MRILAVVVLLGWSTFAATIVRADPPPDGHELRYLVFLRPDPHRQPLPLEDRKRVMDEHMANIHKLADEGVLVAAGPMDDEPTTISGIFIFKSTSLAEARRVAALDPTVAAGRNTVDVHPWWGPAGIGTGYFQWKSQNPEAKDVMAMHVFCIIVRGPAAAPAGEPDRAHEHFIESLHAAGVLSAAGRIDEDPDMRGIVIFKGASLAAAKKAMADDPSIGSGRLAIEYHQWWTADRVLPW